MTMAAAICRPDPTPPAASTGVGATASITSGHRTIDPTSPVCPPPSEPWQMTMSTPAALWFSACLTDPAKAAMSMPWAWTLAITSSGGVPSALATSLTLSCLRITSTNGAAVAAVQPNSSRFGPAFELRHSVVGQDLLDEHPVLVGDHGPELSFEFDRVEFTHPLVLSGNHDVDAVRTVADVFIEPGQFHLELFGAEADRPEHAHPTGVGHGGGHVAAVGEGKDRELNAETFAELVVHDGPPRVVSLKGFALQVEPILVCGGVSRSMSASSRKRAVLLGGMAPVVVMPQGIEGPPGRRIGFGRARRRGRPQPASWRGCPAQRCDHRR